MSIYEETVVLSCLEKTLVLMEYHGWEQELKIKKGGEGYSATSHTKSIYHHKMLSEMVGLE